MKTEVSTPLAFRCFPALPTAVVAMAAKLGFASSMMALACCAFFTLLVDAMSVNTLWTVDLFNETDTAANASRSGSIGYNRFAITDKAGRLYLIVSSETNKTSAHIAWTYNEWPPLSYDVASQRQIYGGYDVVLVIRGTVAYCIDAYTGHLWWSRNVSDSQVREGEFSIRDRYVLVAERNAFEFWDLASGNRTSIVEGL